MQTSYHHHQARRAYPFSCCASVTSNPHHIRPQHHLDVEWRNTETPHKFVFANVAPALRVADAWPCLLTLSAFPQCN